AVRHMDAVGRVVTLAADADRQVRVLEGPEMLADPVAGVEAEQHLHGRPHGSDERGGSAPPEGSVSASRRPSSHLAIRSERVNEPTFSCWTPPPTARWTMVTSSVSPERAETTAE